MYLLKTKLFFFLILVVFVRLAKASISSDSKLALDGIVQAQLDLLQMMSDAQRHRPSHMSLEEMGTEFEQVMTSNEYTAQDIDDFITRVSEQKGKWETGAFAEVFADNVACASEILPLLQERKTEITNGTITNDPKSICKAFSELNQLRQEGETVSGQFAEICSNRSLESSDFPTVNNLLERMNDCLRRAAELVRTKPSLGPLWGSKKVLFEMQQRQMQNALQSLRPTILDDIAPLVPADSKKINLAGDKKSATTVDQKLSTVPPVLDSNDLPKKTNDKQNNARRPKSHDLGASKDKVANQPISSDVKSENDSSKNLNYFLIVIIPTAVVLVVLVLFLILRKGKKPAAEKTDHENQ